MRGEPNYGQANDYEEYLESSHERASRKVASGKGKQMPAKYGKGEGRDNKEYQDRGYGDPDDKKLNRQNLPNNRLSDYFAGY